MRARLRAPNGTSTVTLPDDATVQDLLVQITEKTALSSFDIKYSYPPKPLVLGQKSQLLRDLDVKLDGESLVISAKDVPTESQSQSQSQAATSKASPSTVLPVGHSPPPRKTTSSAPGPIALKKKDMAGDVPEIPFPSRGATVVLRVMPDDNSCLFRAIGTAVLPIDDQTMQELRAMVAGAIQADRETYSRVVLEQDPDDYCRWIQTADAWGGAIELGILSKAFNVEICSIDVQSLRVDRFNEDAENRIILVYSGIHYDTIAQSPSSPPHTRATSPPDFDRRLWPTTDDDILAKAIDLCRVLQAQNYYTDTGGMAIQCQVCRAVFYGQAQAQTHAQQTGHYDMEEVKTAK